MGQKGCPRRGRPHRGPGCAGPPGWPRRSPWPAAAVPPSPDRCPAAAAPPGPGRPRPAWPWWGSSPAAPRSAPPRGARRPGRRCPRRRRPASKSAGAPGRWTAGRSAPPSGIGGRPGIPVPHSSAPPWRWPRPPPGAGRAPARPPPAPGARRDTPAAGRGTASAAFARRHICSRVRISTASWPPPFPMLLTLPRPMARSRAGFTSARRYIKIRRGPRRSTAPVGNQQHLLGGVFVVVSV